LQGNVTTLLAVLDEHGIVSPGILDKPPDPLAGTVGQVALSSQENPEAASVAVCFTPSAGDSSNLTPLRPGSLSTPEPGSLEYHGTKTNLNVPAPEVIIPGSGQPTIFHDPRVGIDGDFESVTC
jgi:hypothetical protein